MDPLAAFSLASGVFQAVDFSTKVVKKSRELYKDGAASENAEVEEMAKHLTNLHTNLDLTDRDGMDELLDLGSKCSQTAEELVAELQKLKVSGPQRRRQVVGKTIKAIWRKSAIDDIESDWKCFHLSDLRRSEGFQDLDLKVKNIITELAQCPQSFDELKNLIQLENGALKAHITSEFHKRERDLGHDQYRRRFLESLWYPEINRRQDVVGEAHQRTFQWIYDSGDSDKSACPWDNMVIWLEQGGGIYWINGKAGSGKSTLMKYIHGDDRTSKKLRAWSGGMELCTPGFFFWNAGTTLEKSSEGLLRSLLYQILQKFPSLTPLSSENQCALGPADDGPQSCEPIAAWTERRLRTAIQIVMRQAQGVCRICMFIDGLDEISGDPDAAIAVIENMQSADFKICLSSRPDRSYTEAFSSCATLRLQDLTEPDIRTYVSDKLQPWLRAEFADDVSEVLNSVASKAQGVFLWVELVVKALIKGLKNDDTLKQLQTRIDSTPSDIEALYAKMLSNIDVAHRRDATRLFQMILAELTRSLLDVALAPENGFDRLPNFSIREAIQVSDRTQKRIPTVCAGLLEVHEEDRDSEKGAGTFRSLDPQNSETGG